MVIAPALHIITQAMAKIKRKHEEEIEAFDKAYNHSMYDLADYLSNGIVANSPEKFDKDKKSMRKLIKDLKKENKEEEKVSEVKVINEK